MKEGEMMGRRSNVIRLRSIVEGYVEASLVIMDDYNWKSRPSGRGGDQPAIDQGLSITLAII